MMRISRTLTAATVVGIATAVAAGPAIAAPGPAPAAPAKSAAAKKKQRANTKIIRAIRIQNRAYLAQRTRVAACAKLGSPATRQVRTMAKGTLSSSARLRAASLRRVNSRAATRALAVKRTNLKKATTKLRTVARRCATVRPVTVRSGMVPATAAATPITVIVSPSPSPGATAPGVSGAPGAPGVSGVSGRPAAPAGTTPVQLSLSHLLGGTPLDLSPVLGHDGILPSTLSIVGLDRLLDGAIAANGLVGIDTQQLLGLIDTSVGNLTACGVNVTCIINNLTPTLNGTLAQVTTLLDAALDGDLTALDDLLEVERLSDTVLRIVPVGPLAGLLAGVGGLDALLGGLQGGGNSAGLLDGLLKL